MHSMMANDLLVARDRITKEFIDSAWNSNQTGWGEGASDEDGASADDGDFRPQMTQLDLEGLASTLIPKTLSISVFGATRDMVFFGKERQVQDGLVIT
jgi:hypothetical protein